MKCSTNLISDVTFFRCKTYRYVPEPEIATSEPGEGSETSHAPPPESYSRGKKQISTWRFCTYIFLSSLCTCVAGISVWKRFWLKRNKLEFGALITVLFVKAVSFGQQYLLSIDQAGRNIANLQIADDTDERIPNLCTHAYGIRNNLWNIRLSFIRICAFLCSGLCPPVLPLWVAVHFQYRPNCS